MGRWTLLALLCGGLLAAPAMAQDDDFDFGDTDLETETDGPVEGEGADEAAPADPPDDDATEAAPTEKAEAEAAKEEVSEEGLELTLEDRIKAVSRKTFIKAGRVTAVPMLAASTNDAFYQHFGVGGRVSWHLVDSLAIDAGMIVVPPYVGTFELPTLRVIRNQYSAVPNVATLFGYGDIGVTFSPIYGKFSILGSWIIHFDAFVSGAVGVAVDSNRYSVFGQELPEVTTGFGTYSVPGFNPAAEVGFGGRIFLLRWLTLRAEVRDYIYPQHRAGIARLQNLVMVQFGVGFYFPFDFEYEYAAAKVVGD
jgi:outer membrane beta-barrel protein